MERYRRLQEEHLKEIKKSRDRISQWERFEADYTALQTRLQSLPEKLSHDIMVPLGRFAYMPGKLYHTNEILVLLGDNWFARRSAKQAVGVAERRKQHVVKQLEQERQNLADLEARYSFTAELQASAEEVVDIKEDYDPEEQERNGARRARKRPSLNPKEEKMSESDVWLRLEQLEKEEEEFIRKETEEGEREVEEVGEVEEEDEKVLLAGHPQSPVIIPVLHTRTDEQEEEEREEESSDNQSTRFTSPGDIFKRHCQPLIEEEKEEEEEEAGKGGDRTAQIKKAVSWDPGLVQHGYPEETSGCSEVQGAPPQHVTRKYKPCAVPFSGLVVERQPLLARAAPCSPQPTTEVEEGRQRKTSKFKSARKGQ